VTRRWLAGALVVAASACGDIATPLRTDFYSWRLLVPSGDGTDSVSFHWPASSLPVKIWVEDAAELPANVPAAIAAWRAAFLYGEFDATVVGDSATADVIVRAGAAPGAQFARNRLHSALAFECSGATDLDLSDDHAQLRLPVRVYVDSRSAPGPALSSCLALTTAHEIGHALGIWRHSPASTDLMFADPVVPGPGERDLNTAELLYHTPSNVQPVRLPTAVARTAAPAGP
jgi:predicted Zn-dependent protease